jgi:hypothetical protein
MANLDGLSSVGNGGVSLIFGGPMPTTQDAQQKEPEFKLKDRQAQFPPSQRLEPEAPIDAIW